MDNALPGIAKTTRLASLDALRGLDMFWIIGGNSVAQALVKASGNSRLDWIPEQLQHVPWDGFHFIDLIFPLFLFMIGVAIPYSLAKRRERGDSLAKIYGHLVIRVVLLMVFGMMVNGSLLTYDPAKFELTYSVLQMLALGYLVAAILFLHLRLSGQVVATLAMLIGYWALLAFVPGPGHEIGKFREGCNLGDWITESLVGKWRGMQIGWILGILGHASTAMLGVFAGQLLRSSQHPERKLAWMTALGVSCIALGVFWSGWVAQWFPGVWLFGSNWSDWPVWFPIIKVRWTSSYVLYAGGWSYLLLALSYLVIDVWGWRRWAIPFMAIGTNSIFAYLSWQLCNSAFRRVSEVFLGGLGPYVGPWQEAIVSAGALGVLWLVLCYLYRKGTLIRV
jgi:predicted acyltransferase